LNISSAVNLSHLYPPDAIAKDKDASGMHTKAVGQHKAIDNHKYMSENYLTDKSPEQVTMACNVDGLEVARLTIDAALKLLSVQRQYGEFYERLKDLRPDIASTGFGFTLDENAKIKILDSTQKLSDADKSWLTEEVNTFKDIRQHVRKHSETLIRLVETDIQKFGGKYNLNAQNFQKTINYGDILDDKWGGRWASIDNYMTKQVIESAEKRPVPLLDVYA
jgi:hypothetical protein